MIDYSTLINKYPNFFAKLPFGIECGKGWYEILDELIGKIIALQPDAQASQIKEKYGELRVYMMSATDEVLDLIDEYTEKSLRTCEVCGKPGELYDDGWLKTRCEEHKDD